MANCPQNVDYVKMQIIQNEKWSFFFYKKNNFFVKKFPKKILDTPFFPRGTLSPHFSIIYFF